MSSVDAQCARKHYVFCGRRRLAVGKVAKRLKRMLTNVRFMRTIVRNMRTTSNNVIDWLLPEARNT